VPKERVKLRIHQSGALGNARTVIKNSIACDGRGVKVSVYVAASIKKLKLTRLKNKCRKKHAHASVITG